MKLEELSKKARQLDEARQLEERSKRIQLGPLPTEFQYRFTPLSGGYCDIFNRMSKSMQHRLIRLWHEHDKPKEMIVEIVRHRGLSGQPYAATFIIKFISKVPRTHKQELLDMSYDKFRKFMLQISERESDDCL